MTYTPIRIDDPVDPDLTDQHLIDLLITAVEHMGYGSFNWSEAIDHVTEWGIYHSDFSFEEKQEFARLTASERVGHAVAKHGRTIKVHDSEEWLSDGIDHSHCGSFDRARLVKAIERWARHRNLSPQDVCEFRNTDVLDADAVVQLAALGEVVFG